jgi:transcriptional repressor NrdR
VRCPKCDNTDTKVTDTRANQVDLSIKRRRRCLRCGYRFLTIEVVCREDLIVIKRDGKEQEFSSAKIMAGLEKSVNKDDKSNQKLSLLLLEIVEEIKKHTNKKIASTEIAEIVMKKLKAFDTIAYLRFASIYKDFRVPQEFESEMKKL